MAFDQIKVELLSSWQGKAGGDGTVAHAAWASTNDIEKLALKTDEDIRRVATNVVNNHHDTPKERLWMEFFITCPIFVERQFDKYRMTVQYQDFQVEFLERPMGGDHITQNELSGRYRTIPDRPYGLPEDVSKIQYKASGRSWHDHNKPKLYTELWTEVIEKQYEWYKGQLNMLRTAQDQGRITNSEYKRAREVLRGILGTAYLTDMRITMNLNAFEHIINQRLAPEAQPESRVVAFNMLDQAIIHKVAPVAIGEMVKSNGWDNWAKEVVELIGG